MKEMITLPDGRELTWDEFSALSDAEQSEAFKQQKKPIAQAERGAHFSNRELLPRIRAAAERNKLSEEDLLAFIKIMHDIFFPPEPIGARLSAPSSRPKQKAHGAVFAPKPVMTPAGRFESLAAATKFYNVDGGRVREWIKKGKEGFYFIPSEG
jgi:hypothetical protein